MLISKWLSLFVTEYPHFKLIKGRVHLWDLVKSEKMKIEIKHNFSLTLSIDIYSIRINQF